MGLGVLLGLLSSGNKTPALSHVRSAPLLTWKTETDLLLLLSPERMGRKQYAKLLSLYHPDVSDRHPCGMLFLLSSTDVLKYSLKPKFICWQYMWKFRGLRLFSWGYSALKKKKPHPRNLNFHDLRAKYIKEKNLNKVWNCRAADSLAAPLLFHC